MRRGNAQRKFPDTPEIDPWIEQLAWLMDRSIPLGRWSIGLDGLLGLVPGVGDFVGSLASSLIIIRGVQARLPRPAILRMIANVAIDTLLGTVPFVGDLFDFAYKANQKNLEVFRQNYGRPRGSIHDWGFLALVGMILLVLTAVPLVGLFYITQWLQPYLPAWPF